MHVLICGQQYDLYHHQALVLILAFKMPTILGPHSGVGSMPVLGRRPFDRIQAV